MGRAPCCDKTNVKRGPWAPEEDAKLKAYIEEHGTGGNWIALPQKIGLRRCGKSCRLRWLNYLRPNIKHGGFSEEEDSVICSLYISIGSRWSIIAAQLPGRTDNDIKNYWNTKLKKRLLGQHRGMSESRGISSSGNEEAPREGNGPAPQALTSSAIERMQLHMQLQGLNSPFSYYNNPLLWPKFHPLPGISQGGQVDGNDTASMQPASNVTAADAHEPFLPNWSSGNMQDEFNHSNSIGNGLSSPSRNVVLDGVNADHSSSSIDSAAARIQAELHDLLYSETNGCFVRQDSHQVSELNRLKELDGEQVNCWINNYIEEKSSHGSWDYTPVIPHESIFH